MVESLQQSGLSANGGLSFIEQLQKMCEIDCSRVNRPYLTGTNTTAALVVLVRPPCKCWNCPSCAARNARRWIARIINGCNHMDTENGWQMFTVTAHEKWHSYTGSVKNLRQGWKKLYNRIRYEYGTQSYVKVWEHHEDGSFHLHGLIDTTMTERWLKDNSRECGMGYQCEIHEVDNAGQVAGYCAKYFLKSELSATLAKYEFPRGLRRIECSRNWLELPPLSSDMEFSWIINQTREGQLRNADWYQYKGYQILDFVKP